MKDIRQSSTCLAGDLFRVPFSPPKNCIITSKSAASSPSTITDSALNAHLTPLIIDSMASHAMPSLFARLFRPFSTSVSLSLGSESSVGSAAQPQFPANAQKATVAAGCFWGVEHLYRKHFGDGKGLLDAKVGYCGGQTNAPSYRAVCSGTTGRMLMRDALSPVKALQLFSSRH
jgi:hypothetical protein